MVSPSVGVTSVVPRNNTSDDRTLERHRENNLINMQHLMSYSFMERKKSSNEPKARRRARMRLVGISLYVILLVACDSAPASDPNTVTPFPQTAFTWKEWTALESPKRPTYVTYYHGGRGLPNMERWKAQDFLPKEYFAAPHADMCRAPQAVRKDLWSMPIVSGDTADKVRQRITYAKKGYAKAQAGLGHYCFKKTFDAYVDAKLQRELSFSIDQAYDWARRGAASGDPIAMYRLADCMNVMARGADLGKTHHDLDPFWKDQSRYWLWRAVTDGLDEWALRAIRYHGRFLIEYPTDDENKIQDYQWSRLFELQTIFRNEFYGSVEEHMQDFWFSTMEEARHRLTPEQLRTAEVAVGKFLKAHPKVWDNIVRLPREDGHSGNVLCPGEPGYREHFNYDSLNRELARYGLHVTPPDK
ncbi:MAG: hypothetical protein HY308_16085 [Gammaproteobacteria bacterium]|nr:hypothetical protein [Gammaproteobacteria bacterium]